MAPYSPQNCPTPLGVTHWLAAAPVSGPDPKGGGGGGALQTPKWLYRTMGFVGTGDFVLSIWQGERGKFFCSTLCVCTQNTQNFVENSKMAEKHKKGF